jgi:hypothetical protein
VLRVGRIRRSTRRKEAERMHAMFTLISQWPRLNRLAVC